MKWEKIRRADRRIEYLCEHGVGHGNHLHGCDNCCSRDDYPNKKSKKNKKNELTKMNKIELKNELLTCEEKIGDLMRYKGSNKQSQMQYWIDKIKIIKRMIEKSE